MSRTATPPAALRPGWPATSNPELLSQAARAFGDGATFVADVLRAVIEDLGDDVAWRTVSGDYPFNWVGVDFLIGGSGAFVRVRSIDLEIRGCAVTIFDRNGCDTARATFENIAEHLAAVIVVAEVTSL